MGKLASVSKVTIASFKPMRAHRSFVLSIGLIFLLLRHLLFAALVAGYEGNDCRGSGESLLAKGGLSSVRRHLERGFEVLRSGVERLSHE